MIPREITVSYGAIGAFYNFFFFLSLFHLHHRHICYHSRKTNVSLMPIYARESLLRNEIKTHFYATNLLMVKNGFDTMKVSSTQNYKRFLNTIFFFFFFLRNSNIYKRSFVPLLIPKTIYLTCLMWHRLKSV